MVTGDSQEEVLIFRDKQTLHHNIYIINLVKDVHHLATQVDEQQGQGPLSHDDQLLRGFRPGR